MRKLIRRWLGIPQAFDNVWIEMCRLQDEIHKLQGRDIRDYAPGERDAQCKGRAKFQPSCTNASDNGHLEVRK